MALRKHALLSGREHRRGRALLSLFNFFLPLGAEITKSTLFPIWRVFVFFKPHYVQVDSPAIHR